MAREKLSPWWTEAVELTFWSSSDWTDKSVGEQFLQSIASLGFVAEKFGDEDPPTKRVKKGDFGKTILSLWSAQTDQLNIEGHDPYDFEATVHLNPSKGVLPHSLHFLVNEEYFRKQQNVQRFLKFAEELYAILRPLQGDIAHLRDRKRKVVVESSIAIGKRTAQMETRFPVPPTTGLSGVYWANFYGPPFVTFFSNAKFDSAPSHYKSRLPDGGYLILTSDSPLDHALPATKKLERALIEYLGPDTFFDKSNPQRILKSPLVSSAGQGEAQQSSQKTPHLLSGSQTGLRQCPECGESQKIEEVSRDSVNDLVSFRCSKCGTLWAVESSLLQ